MQPTLNQLELEKLNNWLFYDHPDGFYTLDLEGNFHTVNNALCSLTGIPRGELIGHSFKSLIQPDRLEQTFMFFHRAISGEQQRYECAIRTNSGRLIFLDITNQPLKIGDTVVGIFGIAKDITENKRKEQALKKATEDLGVYNEELELFRRIIAHDLRSPIAKIMGISRFLQNDDIPNETSREMLGHLSNMAQELDSLIRDLNQVISLKAEGGESREWVSVSDLVQACLKGLQEEISKTNATIKLELETRDKLFTTKAFLLSILKNLLSNAIKYRSPERPLTVIVRSEIIEDQICITISDNGLGMDLDKVSSDLFKMFKRFHPAVEGKGLGLYLVREQVRLLHGQVEVESELGEGSSFKVVLPLTIDDGIRKSSID